MEYKPKKIKGAKEEFFIYQPRRFKKITKRKDEKTSNDNPFYKLNELRFR